MKEVFIVWEEGGSYDSSYTNAILAFETLEEAEQAVKAIEEEMKVLKNIVEASERFNQAWNAWHRKEPDAVQYRAEDRAPLWERLQAEYEAEVKAALKVYPCVHKMDDGREIVHVPDLRDDVSFHASTMAISNLADLTKKD